MKIKRFVSCCMILTILAFLRGFAAGNLDDTCGYTTLQSVSSDGAVIKFGDSHTSFTIKVIEDDQGKASLWKAGDSIIDCMYSPPDSDNNADAYVQLLNPKHLGSIFGRITGLERQP